MLSLVLALTQLALLPDQGRLRCMLRVGALACCCSGHQAEGHQDVHEEPDVVRPSGDHGCCGGEAGFAQPEQLLAVAFSSADVAPADDSCSCLDGAPATRLVVFGGVEDWKTGEAGSALAPSHGALSFEAIVSRPVVPRSIPRTATGPPLHLLYQVFLI